MLQFRSLTLIEILKLGKKYIDSTVIQQLPYRVSTARTGLGAQGNEDWRIGSIQIGTGNTNPQPKFNLML